MNVFIEGMDSGVSEMFKRRGFDIVNDIDKADFVVFTGGHDVSPSLYGERDSSLSFCNENRDMTCSMLFNEALRQKLPMVGICRGAQFLCVMTGGKMCQDSRGHTQSHPCKIMLQGEVRTIDVTSTHHQIMMPSDDVAVIGWAQRQGYDFFINSSTPVEELAEVEAIYSEKYKALGCQFHPEYVSPTHECRTVFFELLDEYLGVSIENTELV